MSLWITSPSPRGSLRVYRIDEEHASYFENPDNELLLPVETHEDLDTSGLTWQGDIPDHGVLYLEISDGSGASGSASVAGIGDIIRVNRYFPIVRRIITPNLIARPGSRVWAWDRRTKRIRE